MIELSEETTELVGHLLTAAVGLAAAFGVAMATDPANMVTLLVIAVLAVSSLFTTEQDDEQPSPTQGG